MWVFFFFFTLVFQGDQLETLFLSLHNIFHQFHQMNYYRRFDGNQIIFWQFYFIEQKNII